MPLNKELRALLDEYVKENNQDWIIFKGQLWWITQSWLDKIVRKYWNKVWLELSAHTLRHTFATGYLKNNSWDIVGLAQILWHNNINTTAIYTQNSLEDLQRKVEWLKRWIRALQRLFFKFINFKIINCQIDLNWNW